MTNQFSSIFVTIVEVLPAFDTSWTHTDSESKQVAKGKLNEHIKHGVSIPIKLFLKEAELCGRGKDTQKKEVHFYYVKNHAQEFLIWHNQEIQLSEVVCLFSRSSGEGRDPVLSPHSELKDATFVGEWPGR